VGKGDSGCVGGYIYALEFAWHGDFDCTMTIAEDLCKVYRLDCDHQLVRMAQLSMLIGQWNVLLMAQFCSRFFRQYLVYK